MRNFLILCFSLLAFSVSGQYFNINGPVRHQYKTALTYFRPDTTGNMMNLADNYNKGLYSFMWGYKDTVAARCDYNALFGYGCEISGGSYSFVSGDRNTIISGAGYNFVIGQLNSLSTGSYNFSAGGSNLLNPSYGYAVCFGYSNTNSANYSSILAGQVNSLNGVNSSILAGNNKSYNGNNRAFAQNVHIYDSLEWANGFLISNTSADTAYLKEAQFKFEGEANFTDTSKYLPGTASKFLALDASKQIVTRDESDPVWISDSADYASKSYVQIADTGKVNTTGNDIIYGEVKLMDVLRFTDNNTSIYKDGGTNELTFEDVVTGTKTLAQLAPDTTNLSDSLRAAHIAIAGKLNKADFGDSLKNYHTVYSDSIVFPALTAQSKKGIYFGTQRFMHVYYPSGSIYPKNTFVGIDAGNYSITYGSLMEGVHNTGIGYATLNALSTGYYNVAVGSDAGNNITTGYDNTLIGARCGEKIITGHDNLMAGYFSGGNVRGDNNVILGSIAGSNSSTNVSNDDNIFIGFAAGVIGTGGTYTSRSIAIGTSALNGHTTGSNNIAIGYQAANNNTTGSNNIVIGYDTDAGSPTGSNQIQIGESGTFGAMYGYYGRNLSGPGGNLTQKAQSAISGGLDFNSGNHTIACGTATGNGSGNVQIQAITANQGSGTTDRTPATIATFYGNYVNVAGDFEAAKNIRSYGCDTVTSASPVLLYSYNNFVITGTADIDSINTASTLPDWSVIYIEFTGTAATNGLVDGKNLILNSNFGYTPNDMIVLQRRGNNFFEISRSVN